MFQILLFSLKNWIFNFKCVCQHLPQGLLRALERSWKLKLLSKCYQIVAQCLRNKSRPCYPKSDEGCLIYLTRIMTGSVFYLLKSLKNYICLPFMQHHQTFKSALLKLTSFYIVGAINLYRLWLRDD